MRGSDNVPSSVSLSTFKHIAVQCAQPSGPKGTFEKKHKYNSVNNNNASMKKQ